MYFILILTLLSFLSAFCHFFMKPIKLFLTRPDSLERKIIAHISSLKHQLSKISMRDDYINYVKTEREISGLEQKLEATRSNNVTRNLIINYGIGYGAQALISMILATLSLYYRKSPVVVFDYRYNFAPFGSIMKFPTGVDGAISVPFWIISSNLTFRSIANWFQLNKSQ